MKDKEFYFHQTPPELCKDIISNIPFNDDDILLEPFAGENGFYDNFPEELQKHRCEIEDGLCFKDFEVSEEAFLRQIENPRSPGNEAFQILFNDFMDEFVF